MPFPMQFDAMYQHQYYVVQLESRVASWSNMCLSGGRCVAWSDTLWPQLSQPWYKHFINTTMQLFGCFELLFFALEYELANHSVDLQCAVAL